MWEIPEYHCVRINESYRVDGNLTSPVWGNIPAIEFRRSQDRQQPAQSTYARGCWDGENLYLAFDCQDSDIRATLTQRDDRVWQEEAVEALIAPYGDLRHYYEFQCSPINTVRDLKVINPNLRAENLSFDGSWDCKGWQTAVHSKTIYSDSVQMINGWWAEWCIPLKTMLDSPAGPILSGEEWRINLYRIDRWPLEEYSSWSPTPGEPFSFHRPTYFGRWIFE